MNWSDCCKASIARERTEVEARYGIKIGQTGIRCATCGRPWGFGGHICPDMRFKQLQEKENGKTRDG
jgi:hypothetical protein